MNIRDIQVTMPSTDKESLKKLWAFLAYIFLVFFIYGLCAYWLRSTHHDFGREYEDMKPNKQFSNIGSVRLYVKMQRITGPSQLSDYDIVAYRIPGTEDIQLGRIIARGLDRLSIRDRKFFVNGEEVTSLTTKGKLPRAKPEIVIPFGFYYMAVDNRNTKRDSRSFGVIPFENIIGKVGPGLISKVREQIE